MDKIITFADKFGARTLVDHAIRNPSFLGDRTPPSAGVVLGVTTTAFISGSRWVALCPSEGCNGCEYVHTEELLFFCCECRNSEFDHAPIRVEMPDDPTRVRVEAYLLARPAWQTRNWIGSETVAEAIGAPVQTINDLRAENREHGIRLLKP